MLVLNGTEASVGTGGPLPGARTEGFPKWGFALIGVLALTLGANGYMVWLSLRGHRDLVRPDYYDAGLDQDGIIARTGMARSPGMEVVLLRNGGSWRAETFSGHLEGAVCRIRLYRPDDRREDKDLDLGVSRVSTDSPGRIHWSGEGPALRRGVWMANLVWERDGKPVMEESFRILVEA
jgi:hypothetical protein